MLHKDNAISGVRIQRSENATAGPWQDGGNKIEGIKVLLG
jgi:hypothetical protein